jgi:hypothetical protein
LKLNGTRKFLVYTDDVNILSETEKLPTVASKGTELEVNADKTKYVVEKLKYLRTILTHKIPFTKKLTAD